MLKNMLVGLFPVNMILSPHPTIKCRSPMQSVPICSRVPLRSGFLPIIFPLAFPSPSDNAVQLEEWSTQANTHRMPQREQQRGVLPPVR